MPTGSFRVIRLDLTRLIYDLTRPDQPTTSEILTPPDQLIMTPKVEFLKYNIKIFHAVKFILKYVKKKPCKHMTCTKSMHGEQQNKTRFILKTTEILKRIFHR